MAYKNKPINAININTIESDIDKCIIEFFNQRNIDIYDVAQVKNISHNLMTLCFMNCYDKLFKPSNTLFNNQKSLIDYDNIDLLTVIANCFIKWSLFFNKSLGLMQFSIFTGIHRTTLAEWRDDVNGLNAPRSILIKNIIECHKMEQINLLNDSQVGALAVANNDTETGLEWAKQTAALQASNTVYILPSERVDRMRLQAPED